MEFILINKNANLMKEIISRIVLSILIITILFISF